MLKITLLDICIVWFWFQSTVSLATAFLFSKTSNNCVLKNKKKQQKNIVLNPICPLCTRKQHVHTNLGNASLLWSYTELRSKKDTESIHYLPIHAKPTKTVPMPVTSQTYLKFCDLSSPQLMYSLILATKTT